VGPDHPPAPNGRRTVYLRLTDFDGNPPPLIDVLRLPLIALASLANRRKPLASRPKPFMSFAAIRSLEMVTWPGCRVLEVGGGNSTLWFLAQGARVTTIEHSAEWLETIRERATPSWDAHLLGGEAALRFVAALPDRSFDIVLIDSLSRVTPRPEALAAARPKVVPGGWIVLDNSDFAAVKPALRHMIGYPSRTFVGYGPASPAVGQTTAWWCRPF
jgi:predicted O-methyltransferase YrrM